MSFHPKVTFPLPSCLHCISLVKRHLANIIIVWLKHTRLDGIPNGYGMGSNPSGIDVTTETKSSSRSNWCLLSFVRCLFTVAPLVGCVNSLDFWEYAHCRFDSAGIHTAKLSLSLLISGGNDQMYAAELVALKFCVVPGNTHNVKPNFVAG